MIKHLLLIAGLIFSFNLRADENTPTEKWITIKENSEISLDIDELSIKKVSSTMFTFVHRTKLANAIKLKDTQIQFDTMVFLSAAECKLVQSKIVADVALFNNKVVAVNSMSGADEPSTPEPGSLHYVVMQKVCPVIMSEGESGKKKKEYI